MTAKPDTAGRSARASASAACVRCAGTTPHAALCQAKVTVVVMTILGDSYLQMEHGSTLLPRHQLLYLCGEAAGSMALASMGQTCTAGNNE
jgi:hypothetical protein